MKHKNFFIVPNQIFELGLKPKEFVVYCCLLRHSDKNTDNCFPSRRLIADECSMDKKTVDSALKELEARGLIKKVCRYRENGSRTSNMYYLVSLLEQRRISLWVASDIRIHKKIKESKRLPTEKKKDIQSALRHRLRFSPIENQAGERVGAVNRFRLTSHRPATPIVLGFVGIPTFHKNRGGKMSLSDKSGW